MSRYFVPMTQAQPRNAMIDFSPINQGLNEIGAARQQATKNAMLQQQMDMQKEQQQFQRSRMATQDDLARRERGGKMAFAIQQMADSDPAKQGAWQRYLSEFGDGNHSPEELDFRTGPKIAAAAFGHAIDPLEQQTAQAKLGLIKAQTAQANQRAEPTKYVEVGGRIVALNNGHGHVAYEAPQGAAFTAFKDAKQQFDVESGLRKEFSGLAKPYFEVRDAYNRIKQSAKEPSAAGDLALIFNYMKLLDPGSVVREGEFATAQNSAGVPDRIRAWYNRIISGERLTDETRKDFVTQANGLYKVQEDQYQGLQGQYRDIAKRSGANPENTIIDHRRHQDVQAINDAKAAISRGADPNAVRQRLIENGIDPSGL